MTGTESLRQLLDERGVGHGGDRNVVYFEDSRGYKAMAYEAPRRYGDGVLCVHHTSTPEQAVEATLGRGTCRKVRAWEDDPRGGGGWVLVCSECDEFLANDGEDGEFDGPNFCPHCGRRVEQ